MDAGAFAASRLLPGRDWHERAANGGEQCLYPGEPDAALRNECLEPVIGQGEFFENRNELNIPEVFAGLVMVILIGLAMEGVVFRAIEARTVRLWGMQR